MVEPGGVTVSETTVRSLIRDVFGALGCTGLECAMLAETLIRASRAGYPSHGLMRIPIFVDDIRSGAIRPAVAPVVVRETVAAVLVDARRCLGPVSAAFAVERATARARSAGIGCAAVRNGNDVGRLGGYVEGPARDGLVTLLMAHAGGGGACVAPFGTATSFLSTNPIAAGIPRAPGKPPLMIDMSTSVASLGSVTMAANEGNRAPEGWLIDERGRPTTDPTGLLDTPRRGALRPLGGDAAGHKGFLLALIVEAFAGALAGAGTSSGHEADDRGAGLFVLIADPQALAWSADFASSMESLLRGIEALPAAGGDGVHLPGSGAAATYESDLEFDGPTWTRINAILGELSLERDYPPSRPDQD